MAIKDVETKCYILALFIRNDGARFLLGSGAYEFKEGQQHFAANTMQNDVVEVQGNDGYLLAGQVRRPGVQSFDGYVGDSSTSKPVVEGLRRDFFQFFRKGYFYKVVYVFPDGSAIQRKRGFLVDAPVVQELYQIYPEYHVALNFEDINYYFYDENDAGEEIYGKSAIVGLSMATGGLVWDNDGAVTDPLVFGGVVTVKGAETINNLLNVAVPLASVGLYGDTFQQTYSGKNLLDLMLNSSSGSSSNRMRLDSISSDSINLTVLVSHQASAWRLQFNYFDLGLKAGDILTLSCEAIVSEAGLDPSIRIAKGSSGINADVIANWRKSTGATTFELPSDVDSFSLWFYANQGAPAPSVGTTVTFSNIQLEQGSTATSFEPYVGGIPSPNPDYPQEVEVVTGQQVVTVSNGSQSQEYEVNLGKNLFDKNSANTVKGYFNTQFPQIVSLNYDATIYIPCQPNTTYTVQRNAGNFGRFFPVGYCTVTPEVGATVYGITFATAENPGKATITTGDNAKYLVARVYHNTQDTLTFGEVLASLQIEKGSAATSYASYFTPIELCKIGEYQDYIYKSGDGWYVHKETGKVTFNGSQTPSSVSSGSNTTRVSYNHYADGSASQNNGLYCNLLSQQSNWSADIEGIQYDSSNGGVWFRINKSTIGTTQPEVLAWLFSNPLELYYAIATPTDTQITDTTLIGQLEALGAAKLYVGENNLMVTASGTNLPAELEVGYYTEIEDGYGFVWEEGRSPSNIIAVDSIDDVFPVLTITGETENPILTNVTTGTIFQYNGTITASQTLVVDMMNQTATLNGTSVIGNVTGDWVYFAPGNNRVSYTAGNANAPDATIEWQEIVG